MTARRSLLTPPLLFAHRGARAHARENTIEAFALARRLGATALESDVWLTSDGVAVLDHDGVVGGRMRKQAIRDVARADLPDHIPTLEAFYEEIGSDLDLSLDVKDPDAFSATLAVANAADATERLWLCHPDWTLVETWRAASADVKLVDSTRLHRIKEGPERRAAELRRVGIDVLNMHYSDWTPGLAALTHRFEVLCFGWDAQQPRVIGQLLDAGLDGVYSDHVDRLVDEAASRGLWGRTS